LIKEVSRIQTPERRVFKSNSGGFSLNKSGRGEMMRLNYYQVKPHTVSISKYFFFQMASLEERG
jgi:hypothetical protein